MNQESIAIKLSHYRKQAGMSQEELADKSGLSVRTIQRIETGKVSPHLRTLRLLAEAMNLSTEDFQPSHKSSDQHADRKKWISIMHLSALAGSFVPPLNIFLPLAAWLYKRKDHQDVDTHGRAIINFQLTTLIAILILVFLFIQYRLDLNFFFAAVAYYYGMMILNVIIAFRSQKKFLPLSIPFLKQRKIQALIQGISIMLLAYMGTPRASAQHIERLNHSKISAEELTEEVQRLMKEAQVQGLALSIFKDSEIVYQEAFGYKNFEEKEKLNLQTSMYGASLSKAVFAVIVMKMIEDGTIDLDTPLESYLAKKIYEYSPQTRWQDNYSDLKEDKQYHKITARMCLNHSSGFPNWRWFEPNEKLSVKFEPGSRYSYSGEGLTYLQVVLEKITGKGLEEMAKEIVFEPLGMNASSYQWKKAFEDDFAYGHMRDGKLYQKDKDNEPRGAGTLETTAIDYSIFLEAVLQKKLLTEDSWHEMFSPQIRIHSLRQFGPLAWKDSTLNDNIELSYGLGWGLLKTPHGWGAFKEGHGNGFQHYSILFPKEGIGIMIMTNSDNGESIFKELLELAIGDVYTPWEWHNYIPYNQ